jgi:hypothetical protein
MGGSKNKVGSWLEDFCNLSMENVTTDDGSSGSSNENRTIIPHPYVKVWAAIARIDGGTGHLLGHAMRDGLYGIRAWIACYLIWSPPSSSSSSSFYSSSDNHYINKNDIERNHHNYNNTRITHDPLMPSGCTTVAIAIKDLESLGERIHRVELQCDISSLFVKDALKFLLKHKEFYNDNNNINHNYDDDYNYQHHGAKSYFDQQQLLEASLNHQSSLSSLFPASSSCSLSSNSRVLQSISSLLPCISQIPSIYAYMYAYCKQSIIHHYRTITSTTTAFPSTSPSRTNLSSSSSLSSSVTSNGQRDDANLESNCPISIASNNPNTNVGQLIVLHCGHNGFLSPHEINLVVDFFTAHHITT